MNIKKVIISAAVIATAALAAQAQGLGTVRDINGYGEEYLIAMRAKAAMQQVEKEAQKQHIARLRAEQKKAEQAQQQQAKNDAQNEPAAQTAVDTNQTPSYYYGREGKVLALSDRTAKALSVQTEPAAEQTTAKPEPKKSSEAKTQKKESFWRYFLPGPLPGESWGEYSQRMSYAGNQPFK